MDHSGHDMSGATTTSSAPAAAATTPGSHSMGGMGGNSCKISMLWNWNTIDSCFITRSWHIKSSGMFAGSCIGVVLLVMTLELLRRSVKEYDRYLLKKAATATSVVTSGSGKGDVSPSTCVTRSKGYRPNFLEQAIRALLHMLQFAVAYFVMLLAMYYNGYIIICIFIGAYLGSFVFHWETLGLGGQTSATEEATVCCG
ncbi:Ctr copper transporter family-domain-containing protein [Podospora fimiseda]|uniref:Copper transport protein n=1 Tax=Podospora fimiseda TaxID=252190 RepID=A0AAN7BE89_9PEZI|nr:Ctr copper transporter family-domain-containing protein [Podospora fimiseda]